MSDAQRPDSAVQEAHIITDAIEDILRDKQIVLSNAAKLFLMRRLTLLFLCLCVYLYVVVAAALLLLFSSSSSSSSSFFFVLFLFSVFLS